MEEIKKQIIESLMSKEIKIKYFKINYKINKYKERDLSGPGRGSNHCPQDYQTGALSTGLVRIL